MCLGPYGTQEGLTADGDAILLFAENIVIFVQRNRFGLKTVHPARTSNIYLRRTQGKVGPFSDLRLTLVARGGGDRGSTVVKVLCYKSEGCWFDPSWCQWIFH